MQQEFSFPSHSITKSTIMPFLGRNFVQFQWNFCLRLQVFGWLSDACYCDFWKLFWQPCLAIKSPKDIAPDLKYFFLFKFCSNCLIGKGGGVIYGYDTTRSDLQTYKKDFFHKTGVLQPWSGQTVNLKCVNNIVSVCV